MAMAGQGLNAAPPPRPPSHNHFGAQNNPGNQLYVGNVSFKSSLLVLDHIDTSHFHILSFPIKLGGRI